MVLIVNVMTVALALVTVLAQAIARVIDPPRSAEWRKPLGLQHALHITSLQRERTPRRQREG
eukprot:8870993-Pyramimonas_sp.AAC.1